MSKKEEKVTRNLLYRCRGEYCNTFEDALKVSVRTTDPAPIYLGTRYQSDKNDVFLTHRVFTQAFIDWPKINEEK